MHKYIEIETSEKKGNYSIKITEQSHTFNSFGKNNNIFKASNGIVLRSSFEPEWRKNTNECFLAGISEDKKSTPINFTNKKDFEKVCKAIDEYNETFCEVISNKGEKNKIDENRCITFIPSSEKFSIEIVNQTHRGKYFTEDGNSFEAKNGIRIISDSYPDCHVDFDRIFVRGSMKSKDNESILFRNEKMYKRAIEALNEYNKIHCENKIKEEVKEKVLEIESEWNEKFNIGLMKIINQKTKPKLFTAKNGITITSNLQPSFMDNILFIRGSDTKLDDMAIIIRSKENFDKILEAVNEYNDSNKIDYVRLHKELWIGISEGKDQREFCKELCEKYEIPIPKNYCFLCQETVDKYRDSNLCSHCSGKWFPNEKGKCLDNKSYYNLFGNEPDPDLQKALAIRISKCAD